MERRLRPAVLGGQVGVGAGLEELADEEAILLRHRQLQRRQPAAVAHHVGVATLDQLREQPLAAALDGVAQSTDVGPRVPPAAAPAAPAAPQARQPWVRASRRGDALAMAEPLHLAPGGVAAHRRLQQACRLGCRHRRPRIARTAPRRRRRRRRCPILGLVIVGLALRGAACRGGGFSGGLCRCGELVLDALTRLGGPRGGDEARRVGRARRALGEQAHDVERVSHVAIASQQLLQLGDGRVDIAQVDHLQACAALRVDP